MMKIIRRNIYIITFVIIIILSVVVIIRKNKLVNNNYIVESNIVKDNEEVIEEYIYVDIKGEVNNPNVYKVNNNLRVIDIINLAGGLTENADTSNINLSKIVTDEMVIVIKNKEDNVSYIDSDISINSKLININTCSMDELLSLPGIGESKAKNIIEYRNSNKFNKLEDIMNVSGISESLFNKIKEYITI